MLSVIERLVFEIQFFAFPWLLQFLRSQTCNCVTCVAQRKGAVLQNGITWTQTSLSSTPPWDLVVKMLGISFLHPVLAAQVTQAKSMPL